VLRNTSRNYDRLLTINGWHFLRLISVRLQLDTNKIHPFFQSSQAKLYTYRRTARSKIQHHCGMHLWSIFIKVLFLCAYVTAEFQCVETKGFKKLYTKYNITELQCITQFSVSLAFLLQIKKKTQISIREILCGTKKGLSKILFVKIF
jgi:hypothetical protein